MAYAVETTGLTGNSYKALLRKQILRVRPSSVGMALAYVSTQGFRLVKEILDEGGVGEIRLVADAKDFVTHPNALRSARDSGWHVRVVDSLPGTFHPKLYIGGGGFNDIGAMTNLSLAIAGSPNLSRGGFARNGECVFWSDASHSRRSAAKAWLSCWSAGDELTDERLTAYEKQFALRNLGRNRKDMIALGVADNFPKMVDGAPKRGVAPPRSEQKAISETAASVAWAGLQSFTGEYKFQVEFPKVAGGVLNRILGRPAHGNAVDINCEDRETREFKFKYYPDNGMFRLNIPNEVPLVDWAREHKAGIACVESREARDNPYFEILKPGRSMMDIMERSFALGTWGRTRTRLYGWC